MKNHLLFIIIFLTINLSASEFVVNDNSSLEQGIIMFNIGEYSFDQ